MNDCTSAASRDRLPDLLHDRLDPIERAAVSAHVDACADCRREVALLMELREALAAVSGPVNVERVVHALPAPGTVHRRARERRQTRFDWRVAAAIVVLVGGGTFALRTIDRADPARVFVSGSDSASPEHTTPAVIAGRGAERASDTMSASAHAGGVGGEATELAIGGGLSDLNDGELRALIGEIERLDVLPSEQPETGATTAPALAPEVSA